MKYEVDRTGERGSTHSINDVKLSPLGFAYIIYVVPIDHHTVHRSNYSFIYLLCVKHVLCVA